MAMGTGTGTRFEINITPYIDVLLVLLITFMLMSQRLVIHANIAREGGAGDGTHSIVLELADDGRYLLNTRAVSRDSLPAVLREVFAPRPDKVLFLKSGGRRLYGEAIDAIDVAKGAGVEIVAIAP